MGNINEQATAQSHSLLVKWKINQNERSKYSTQLEYWANNPLDYMVERIGIPREYLDWSIIPEYKNHIWDGTENPLKKLLECLTGPPEKNWIGVESATSTGKTVILAGIVFWFLECFANSLVVTSAPKEEQLSLQVWRWISKWYPKFNKGRLTSLKLRMQEGNEDWVATGFVAGVEADAELNRKAQGLHAEHMLIICEETPGIPHQILEAFTNTSTGEHNIVLCVGNPDNELDELHMFCQKQRVNHIIISAYDHPNIVTGNNNFIPGAQTSIGIAGLLETYGNDENHPMYLSRARGICPAGSQYSLIKAEWIRNAVDRFKDKYPRNKINLNKIEGIHAMGLDVANSDAGDKAAKAKGKGFTLYSIEAFQCPNANKLGKEVFREMQEEEITDIQVDGVGVGAGTVNTMIEKGLTKSINFQSAAKPVEIAGINEKFNNLRSQAWWFTRELFRKDMLDIVEDKELMKELATPLWNEINDKITVESKEEIKKRLGYSPNKADAFVMWVWNHYKDELIYFYMLDEKVHDLPYKINEDRKGYICGIRYGDVTAAYFGYQDSGNNYFITNEWSVNDINIQLEEKALSFANYCNENKFNKLKVICHTTMFNYPVKSAGGAKPIVQYFMNAAKQYKGIQLEFIQSAKTKSTTKPYEEYSNELCKNMFNWKKDENGLWIRKPKAYVSVQNCPEFWRYVPQLKAEGNKLEPNGYYDAFKTLATNFELKAGIKDSNKQDLMAILNKQNRNKVF